MICRCLPEEVKDSFFLLSSYLPGELQCLVFEQTNGLGINLLSDAPPSWTEWDSGVRSEGERARGE